MAAWLLVTVAPCVNAHASLDNKQNGQDAQTVQNVLFRMSIIFDVQS